MGDFEKAVDDISNKVNKTMTDDELKEIYALYKQATVGDINVPRPGMLDFKVNQVAILNQGKLLNYIQYVATSLEKFCI